MPPRPATAAAELLLKLWLIPDNYLFVSGTCEGLLCELPTAFGVVAVNNHHKGNGQFSVLMGQLRELAQRKRRDLLVLEIHNPRLGPHLATKHGYTLVADGQHAFLAVAGPGAVPPEFRQARPANPLDAFINHLITL